MTNTEPAVLYFRRELELAAPDLALALDEVALFAVFERLFVAGDLPAARVVGERLFQLVAARAALSAWSRLSGEPF